MKASAPRGMTLVEMILGLTIFSCFMVLMFRLFLHGYQAFTFLNIRQSVQGQVLRIKNLMTDDFERSHFRSFGSLEKNSSVDATMVARDSACCLILSDWSNADSFSDPDGIPNWDRYALYKCSLDKEGVLTRIVIVPPDPLPLRVKPLEDLDSLGLVKVNSQTLTQDLYSFRAKGDPYTQKISVQVVLLKKGGKRGLDDNRTSETFEANFQFNPRNTTGRL